MKKISTVLLLASMAFSGCQSQVPPQSSVQTTTPTSVRETQQNSPNKTTPSNQQTANEQGMYVLFYQGALADLSLRYADAKVYTTALLNADPNQVSKEEWLKFADLTNTKQEEAEQATKRADGEAVSDSEVRLSQSSAQPSTTAQPVVYQSPNILQPPVVVLPKVPTQPVVPAVVQPAVKPQSQPPILTEPVSEKPSYNGTYVGSSSASVGVAEGSVSVNGEALSGRVTYRESVSGKTFTLGLNVNGTVNEEGKVSGRFSGSQKLGGTNVTVGGSFSGGIYGNEMSLRFSGNSSATGGVSGSYKLYK